MRSRRRGGDFPAPAFCIIALGRVQFLSFRAPSAAPRDDVSVISQCFDLSEAPLQIGKNGLIQWPRNLVQGISACKGPVHRDRVDLVRVRSCPIINAVTIEVTY